MTNSQEQPAAAAPATGLSRAFATAAARTSKNLERARPVMPSADPGGNALLRALPSASLGRLGPRMDLIQVAANQVLQRPTCPVSHVYFPIDPLVALLHVMEDGSMSETAVVGWEGMVGVTGFMGGGSPPGLALAQSPGRAYRLDCIALKEEFDTSPEFRKLLFGYTQALLTQMTQIAACNRYHTIDQQLCRWLLLCLDRLPSRSFHITQKTIADMLGVCRGGITAAARKLQSAGLISYSRGRISILDRAQLEERCCECYRVIREGYQRLLPAPQPHRRAWLTASTDYA